MWRRFKEAVGVDTDANAVPQEVVKEDDCSQTSNKNQCNSCKLTLGALMPANYTIPKAQYRDFDYQTRIANRHAGPEIFGYTYGGTTLDRTRQKLLGGKNEITISEWLHGGIRFDGFWRSMCTVVEAKAHYKQFFDARGRLHPWAATKGKKLSVLDGWLVQATAHYNWVASLGEPAKLEWHFLEAECYGVALKAFTHMGHICRHSP